MRSFDKINQAALLDKIDAGLTTNDLFTMNGKVALQHQDADAVAKAYLEAHSYFA